MAEMVRTNYGSKISGSSRVTGQKLSLDSGTENMDLQPPCGLSLMYPIDMNLNRSADELHRISDGSQIINNHYSYTRVSNKCIHFEKGIN